MSKFQEGNKVILVNNDYCELGLPAGSVGTMWAEYQGEPPAYEVTFYDRPGVGLDMTLSADEMALVPVEQSVREEVAA